MFSGGLQRRDLCTHLFLVKGSPNFLVTHLCGSYSVCLAVSSSFFSPPIFFLNPSYRAHFQPLFPVRPVIHHWVLCDPFHRAHHGNLVRPGKNAPPRTQGHILYKRATASGSFFFRRLLAGMAKHKPGSVWRKPLLFIDWGTRMTERLQRIFIKWVLRGAAVPHSSDTQPPRSPRSLRRRDTGNKKCPGWDFNH